MFRNRKTPYPFEFNNPILSIELKITQTTTHLLRNAQQCKTVNNQQLCKSFHSRIECVIRILLISYDFLFAMKTAVPNPFRVCV